jgi:2,3-bisphosphoglycerate-independent phosphoglycerate mutase
VVHNRRSVSLWFEESPRDPDGTPLWLGVLSTADHGNCDEMLGSVTDQPHAQRTAYPVPFMLISEDGASLGTGRGSSDVVPTELDLPDFPQPAEMTGRSLILKQALDL